MGAYMMWMLLTLVALAGVVLLLFAPGIWVVALLAVAVVAVVGLTRAVGDGIEEVSDVSSGDDAGADERKRSERRRGAR